MNKKILDIPKIKQIEDSYCGIAHLYMVFNYLREKKSQKELISYFDDPDRGVYAWEIRDVAKKLGFKANIYENMDIENISKFINKNSPIIAKCWDHNGSGSVHYYLIKGYDLEKNKIFVNDSEDLEINEFNYNFFKKIWSINVKEEPERLGLVISKCKNG